MHDFADYLEKVDPKRFHLHLELDLRPKYDDWRQRDNPDEPEVHWTGGTEAWAYLFVTDENLVEEGRPHTDRAVATRFDMTPHALAAMCHPPGKYHDRYVPVEDAAEIVRCVADGQVAECAWEQYFRDTPELRKARKLARIAYNDYVRAEAYVWTLEKGAQA